MRRSIVLTFSKEGGAWLISGVQLAEYDPGVEWTTATSTDGVEFQYPESLTTQFILPQNWPPTLSVQNGNLKCMEGTIDGVSGQPMQTKKIQIEDREYCLATSSDPALGIVYVHMVYATLYGGKVVQADFTLRYPECMNYKEPNRSACTKEQGSFDINGVVDRIVQSVKLP